MEMEELIKRMTVDGQQLISFVRNRKQIKRSDLPSDQYLKIKIASPCNLDFFCFLIFFGGFIYISSLINLDI